MYGKRRTILRSDARQTVVVAGGRSYHPMGWWYQKNGKYFADLRAPGQWYAAVNTETIGIRGFGGCATQKELRDRILAYHNDVQSHELKIK